MILYVILEKIANNSLIVDAVGLAIIVLIISISTIFIVRSMLFRIADDINSNHENYLRERYKRDNYWGEKHPDHFDYQRKVGKFTYFPNTKKAKQYYKQKRKVQNHQRNYKGYNTQYKKRYKKKRRY